MDQSSPTTGSRLRVKMPSLRPNYAKVDLTPRIITHQHPWLHTRDPFYHSTQFPAPLDTRHLEGSVITPSLRCPNDDRSSGDSNLDLGPEV